MLKFVKNIKSRSLVISNIVSQDFSIELVLSQEWTDPRLSFPNARKVKLAGREGVGTLWTPETTFANALNFEFQQIEMWDNDFFTIYHDGRVFRESRWAVSILNGARIYAWIYEM